MLIWAGPGWDGVLVAFGEALARTAPAGLTFAVRVCLQTVMACCMYCLKAACCMQCLKAGGSSSAHKLMYDLHAGSEHCSFVVALLPTRAVMLLIRVLVERSTYYRAFLACFACCRSSAGLVLCLC